MRQEQSVEQQLRAIREYCQKHGLQLRHEFIDEARSGGSTVGRHSFNRMMVMYETEQNRPNGLLLWNYGRFARDIDDSQFNKLLIRQWGVIIHSLNDPIPEGDYGRVIEFLIDVSNEEKLKQTRDDSKRGLHDLVRIYGCVPGSPPRGFVRELVHIGIHRDGTPRNAHKWKPDPEMAPIILKAFEMRSAGQSLQKIQEATHLYNSINSYATFWCNKIYIGILEFGEDLIIENYCDPIVPRKLWEKVQEVQNHYKRWTAEKGSHVHPRRANSRFLLSGLAYCSLCGSPLYGHSSKQRSGKTLDSYYCTRAWRKRDCVKRRIQRQLIEDRVIELFRDVILQPENISAIYSQLSTGQQTALAEQDRQRKDISRRLSAVERKLTNIANAIAETGISPTLTKRLHDLEADKTKIQQEQNVFETKSIQPIPKLTQAQSEKTCDYLRSILEKGTHDQKQSILRGLIQSVHARRADDGIHGVLEYYYPPEAPDDKSPPISPQHAVRTSRPPSGPPKQNNLESSRLFCFNRASGGLFPLIRYSLRYSIKNSA
jgi:site-specific DNA recombinase